MRGLGWGERTGVGWDVAQVGRGVVQQLTASPGHLMSEIISHLLKAIHLNHYGNGM